MRLLQRSANLRFLGSLAVTVSLLAATPLTATASSAPSTAIGVSASTLEPPDVRRTHRLFSDGCHYGLRGMSSCGGLIGAAYGGNTDPAAWEQALGHPLGVHRTYWGAGKEDAAVRVAADDLAHLRVPWLSFKLPYSWTDMADGVGDDWVRLLLARLGALDGPVWLAFHHEPEGDGDITEWVRMQKHLGPIVRSTTRNVAFTLILTGWHEFYGGSKYQLSRLWPHVKVYLIGFDIYDKYGAFRNGVMFKNHTDFVGSYFTKIQSFAVAHHVHWGIAETGQTDLASIDDPDWAARTYQELRANGGIAMAYFNSTLNSTASWYLTGSKEQHFAAALQDTPTL